MGTERVMTPLGELPWDWKYGTTEYIALPHKGAIKIGPFGSQLKKTELVDSGYRVYGQENVLRNDWTLGNRFVTAEKFESLQSVELQPGDVVVTMMGSAGSATIVPDGIPHGIMDSHLLRIQVDESKAAPQYIAALIRDSGLIKKQVRAMGQGGIMTGLNAEIIRSLCFPLPPLAEQRKIAAILSSVDEAIEKTQAVIDQAQVVKKGLMQELLRRGLPGCHTRFKHTEIGELPEEWKVTTLGELAELVTSGSRGWAKYYAESGALFIRSQNVRAGVLDLGDLAFVKPPTGTEGSRTRVLANDVLVTITGNSVGNVAYTPAGLGEAYVSQHVGLVRLNQPELAPYVTQYFSPGAPGNWQILAAQYGQSKPGLNLTDLRSLIVPLPSAKEREQIADGLLSIQRRIDAEQDFKAGLERLKQGLMSSLLAGEVRVIREKVVEML